VLSTLDAALVAAGHRSILVAQRSDVARLAADCGFSVVRDGVSPFRFWDALAFELTRAA